MDLGSPVIGLVADLSPRANEHIWLKSQLFGSEAERRTDLKFGEAEILEGLGASESSAAFDGVSLGLRARGEALSRNFDASRWLIERMFQSQINPLGAEILEGLIFRPRSKCGKGDCR